jgi:hypothetical protein
MVFDIVPDLSDGLDKAVGIALSPTRLLPPNILASGYDTAFVAKDANFSLEIDIGGPPLNDESLAGVLGPHTVCEREQAADNTPACEQTAEYKVDIRGQRTGLGRRCALCEAIFG